MATLTSSANPVIVTSGPYIPGLPGAAPTGPTGISYTKTAVETVWENVGGGGWAPRITDRSTAGGWTQRVRAGQLYEAAVFRQGETPTFNSGATAYLRVGAIARGARRPLIIGRSFASGGTWCGDVVRTSALTHIIVIGADATPPPIDTDGLPHFNTTAAVPAAPLSRARRMTHAVDLVGLQPGMLQTYAVVVMNSRGEWDVAFQQFATLRRRLTVSFPQITILNDGDNDPRIFGQTFPDPGEANFWFRVRYGTGAARPSQTFQTHRIPIYDGRAHGIQTGVPLPTTIVQTDGPRAIPRGENAVFVESWALEHDPPFGADAADSILDPLRRGFLPLPGGRGENATGSFRLDCLPSSAGSPLHYTTDVSWNVSYVP